ncbi:MAG: type II toxin-antitoxin system RelE/ParE family toxin [Ancrocorticia sp.]
MKSFDGSRTVVEKTVNYWKRAEQDLRESVLWYRDEAGPVTAERFIDAVLEAEVTIRDFPEIGSMHFAHLMSMAVLRTHVVPGFPYLMFYVATENGVDIIRILHQSRDIPSHLMAND